MARRDLYDARFQLISQGDKLGQEVGGGKKDLDFLEAPSDLVPGVYEGGLKTWECSLDLVACLRETSKGGKIFRRKSILEVGCGTAVPSVYILQELFTRSPPPPEEPGESHIHLQDYNDLVFRLITFPNIILCWYMSPAADAFRDAAQSSPIATEDPRIDAEPLPPPDPTQPGDLSITPELKAAFLMALERYHVSLRFFSGSWDTFDFRSAGRDKYDIVLTSETIYRMDSLPSLVGLLRHASLGPPAVVEGEDSKLAKLSQEHLHISMTDDDKCLCLVAAKLVYFGVGGGVTEFIRAVEGSGKGLVETIWEKNEGVKRRVLKVLWCR